MFADLCGLLLTACWTPLAGTTVRPATYRRAALADTGLEFMRLVSSSDIGVATPDVGLCQRLIEQALLPQKNTLFIGDNVLNDLARPQASGPPGSR